MRHMRTLMATILLLAAMTFVTPALAGPQNGEVNHARSNPTTYPCSGETENLFMGFNLLSFIVLVIPIDSIIPPDWLEDAEQE